jgi:hypothetical protein
LDLILRPHTTTLVAQDFAYGAEEAYFPLHRAICSTPLPDAQSSLDRLLAHRVEGGSALVLGTGPSAGRIDPKRIQEDIRIACNSVVRDHALLAELAPNVIAFGDPVFHFGPSRYARAFRDDLLLALEMTDAVAVTTNLFVEPLVAHVPEIADRLVVLTLDVGDSWWWPTRERPSARVTGNVLTNLMLPIAFALADTVAIAGCDGRRPEEKYFWAHNNRIQYADDLMQTVFDAHPAFFRDRSYVDYYDVHCAQLDEFLTVAERAGKNVSAVTPSYIPALRHRGADLPAPEPALT